MQLSLLKQVVLEQATRSIPKDFVERSIYSKVNELKKSQDIIIITGIRRCGKSTLLQKIRHEEKESSYYLNFEDDRLINFTVNDFQTLLEIFLELFGPQNTFYFDEIQNIPDWERFVRRLHEDGNKIYITGSNATMLSKELGTKLTGRYIALTMYPYSFQEFISYRMVSFSRKSIDTTQEIAQARRLFNEYFQLGGIPEYVKYEQIEYLQGLYEGIIYRDVITRYKLTHEKPLKELAFYLASNVGKEITYNALRKIINLSNATTVSEYCHYLENSFLCFIVNRYSHSLKQQHFYQKKQYFIDHALANVVGFRTSADKGRFLENIVFLQLLRLNKEVYFFHEKNECDFIVKNGKSIESVIQVTLHLDTPETKKREYAGLLEALECYHMTEGLIITENQEYQESVSHHDKDYNIQVMPIWKWLLM